MSLSLFIDLDLIFWFKSEEEEPVKMFTKPGVKTIPNREKIRNAIEKERNEREGKIR